MDETLRGKLLIASPSLADPDFARTVVLLTEHDAGGAMGIVLNRASEAVAAEAIPDLAEVTNGEPLYIGGPVQPDAVLLLAEFSDRRAAASIIAADIGLASAEYEIEDLDSAVSRGRLFAGYAGWGPGQIEREMADESWFVEEPLASELLCEDPDSLWSDVLRRKGGEYAIVAMMPDDPSMN